MPHHPVTPQKRKTYGGSRAVRLRGMDYAGDVDIHVVACVRSGKPFLDESLAGEVCKSVECTSERFGYRLYGYCLMPDHVHVLLSPAGCRRPLRDWLQAFKSYTAHWAKSRLGSTPLWQRSSFDHVCRNGETAEVVLNYILNNPLRAGLVERAGDWPWSRSFLVPFPEG
ncbi:MAG: hypothetical protein GY842_19070 [bacterium]|nr:hypothetical protein [bacterium]